MLQLWFWRLFLLPGTHADNARVTTDYTRKMIIRERRASILLKFGRPSEKKKKGEGEEEGLKGLSISFNTFLPDNETSSLFALASCPNVIIAISVAFSSCVLSRSSCSQCSAYSYNWTNRISVRKTRSLSSASCGAGLKVPVVFVFQSSGHDTATSKKKLVRET